MPPLPRVACLCTDLLFTSKIRETAGVLGCQAETARDPAELVLRARGARLVIVDLRRADALAALDALIEDAVAGTVPVVGFCDHERVELMAEAEARGCRALAKGKFSSALRHLLAGEAPGSTLGGAAGSTGTPELPDLADPSKA